MRRTRLTTLAAGAAGSTANFPTENGFFPNPGIADFWVFGHHRFDLPGPVRWIELGAVGTFDVGQLDQPLPVPEEAEVEGWVKTQLPGVTDVKFELEHWDAR